MLKYYRTSTYNNVDCIIFEIALPIHYVDYLDAYGSHGTFYA